MPSISHGADLRHVGLALRRRAGDVLRKNMGGQAMPTRGNKEKNKVLIMIGALGVVVALALVVLFASPITALIERLSRDQCDPRIAYSGQTFSLDSALSFLRVKVTALNEASHQISDLIQVFAAQSEDLCRQRQSGAITSQDYLQQKQHLSDRFAGLAAVVETVRPADVRPENMQAYVDAIRQLAEGQSFRRTQARLDVVSPERGDLRSGDILESGDFYYLVISVDPSAYAYVFTITSDRKLVRLYPSATGGTRNPIAGQQRIPADPRLDFQLDKRTGAERIVLFLESTASPALEALADEVTGAGGEAAEAVLQRLVLRGTHVAASPVSAEQPEEVLSSMTGNIAAEFLINHRAPAR